MAKKPVELAEPLPDAPTDVEKEELPLARSQDALVILVAAIFQQTAGRDDPEAVFDRAKAFVERGASHLHVHL